MRRRRIRHTFTAVVMGCLFSALLTPAAFAAPKPITEPAEAVSLAAGLGDDRTAGVYYRDDRLVVGVTDRAAAAAVESAGGTPEIVDHSAAELDSVQEELDQLPVIANTAWGMDPSTNQVSVEIYDGVPAADLARIEELAAAHGDAVRIERVTGTVEPAATYEMRGGIGITSNGRRCSAAFNVQNNAGKKFFLTAGHCMLGGFYDWSRTNGHISLGRQVSFGYGGDGGDQAVVEYRNSSVKPYGVIQYKNGTEGQITNSRYAYDGEKVKRVGTMSQDLVGMVLVPSMTVNYGDGVSLRHMIKTSLCLKSGDSGGALFTGTTALGISSAGNYVDKPCGDSDAQSDRSSFYHPVQKVLNNRGLKVY
ncbi:S1 family peptidase [Streptomyces sp. cmx-18-6]|uniref:S1 family peptidase n=1 Tax=Streptomyces sp. cmx-18-6 TaxID=2790930 RepID=UPI003980C673